MNSDIEYLQEAIKNQIYLDHLIIPELNIYSKLPGVPSIKTLNIKRCRSTPPFVYNYSQLRRFTML